ncbi:PiggyBac transposable element-derived protein 2 [Elysia marginata]|uniref:PiggyBac transposable element-derived protein 2 n=1 Tax=Elysia marginata TaxID=1093978 RepID=A0AAV4IWY7_9GAST|nr:PiggyBac transposable element-derived protein 2 [Elysia marginata]
MDEQMWVRDMPLPDLDTRFTGNKETPLETMKTPHEFFKEIATDEMMDWIEKEANIYALAKTGKEPKSTRKEIETFIELYLKMGLQNALCTRAHWAAKTRYPTIADWMTRNRPELSARTIHFTDNDKPQADNRVWTIQPWLTYLQETLENFAAQKRKV